MLLIGRGKKVKGSARENLQKMLVRFGVDGKIIYIIVEPLNLSDYVGFLFDSKYLPFLNFYLIINFTIAEHLCSVVSLKLKMTIHIYIFSPIYTLMSCNHRKEYLIRI